MKLRIETDGIIRSYSFDCKDYIVLSILVVVGTVMSKISEGATVYMVSKGVDKNGE